MSLKGDFLSLINALWDVEQFNMWNPKEHASLAYVLDQMNKTNRYSAKYEYWLELAKEKNANALAWEILTASVEVSRADDRVPSEEVSRLEKFLQWEENDYKNGTLSGFGLIKDDFAPDWFWELFDSYIKLEEAKRENGIKAYFVKECAMTRERANNAYEKLYKHYDLLNEFYFFVRNNRFKSFNPITSKGYTAQQLHESTYLSPVGAYNYLIYLRESPKEALEDLKKGLPRK